MFFADDVALKTVAITRWSNVAISHLFGAKKNSAKTWKLKLYEVNGIDSTGYITPNNGINYFQNNELSFRNASSGYKNDKLYIYSNLYTYSFSFIDKKKLFFYSFIINGPYDAQCKASICERNILTPEINTKIFEWKIIELKKHEFVITASLTNNYKLIFIN